ncbi:symplekin-like [Mizuhopecten yessoensis]|uniref:Symplekin n=1 Tax=Mizuhopecten yessoensis TaxID=6573 RepID=A0A210PW07_MIZYE|nr:symplekin-like [Mizuhopecten yessoensis]OWF40642.1 Symplekin [Mizuhopecten yessoensis]
MAGEHRRSTVAQFFEEEDDAALESTSTYDRVVDLINKASLMQKDAQKINNLKQVQELIIHKEPNLLDNFLDEMLAFQSDRTVDVRKFVISFMEEACKKDMELLPKILPCLQLLLEDENVNIQKKVILIMSQVYKCVLQWMCSAKGVNDEKMYVWEMVKSMKIKLLEMADSENDGVRTHVVKFLEGMVMILSHSTSESEFPKNFKPESDINLSIVPEDSDNKYLKLKRLEDEGKNIFETMLHFQASPHISSINLMTVMGSITAIAKQRPAFFGKVVQAFESLQVNLPPTLAKSQVSSVRKNLKMHMLSLLRHRCSADYMTQITTLLTDLGATNSEVMKAMPKIDESKKRKAEESTQVAKKAKIEEVELDDDDAGMTPFVDRTTTKSAPTVKQQSTAVDITSEDLESRLNAQNVADLVLISMVMLPDTMPAHFQSTYTPIAAAGTEGQIKHIARLLSTQLTTAGMGKGVAETQAQSEENEGAGGESPAYQPSSPKQLIQTVVGGLTDDLPALPSSSKAQSMQPPAPVRRGIKQFKLSSVTQELNRDDLDQMTISAVGRILNAEKSATQGNVLPARTKLLAGLTSQFGGELRDLLEEYIFEDLRSRFDLAFAWLYQEYANCMGFCAPLMKLEKPSLASYDECLTRLLAGLLGRVDLKEGFFQRVLIEAPAVTDNAILILKKYCLDENRVVAGMSTLKELILTRPVHRHRFLNVMLESCSHDKPEVRSTAIRFTKKLYEKPQIAPHIEEYASKMLKYLLLPKPPSEMFPRSRSGDLPQSWIEDIIKMCLYLYLGLLPSNHKLIQELAVVYTSATADIKRTILRVLENPVKGMGMQSPELLLLVENCPKGAETLVTRVIHILTDKAAPSQELVERVRDLYHKRVPDVRFLIPVLTGLHKREVILALPKLIKLNPVVVKEVFNRLLGGHGETSFSSPLTPAELLISLHNIDPNKCDMKTIIKATNLCFSEKNVYTQEALAVVMKSLMEQAPLPTLFMRTVLQSLSMYPRLLGFVLNILQRLITKQVWKQKRVWEGFIKCCQRTKPQSFQVLLQLPSLQLKSVFESCPELREPLLNHVKSFTEHQITHIPKAIMAVLEKDPLEEQQKQAQKENMEAEARRIAEAKSITGPPEVLVQVRQEPMETQVIQTVGTVSHEQQAAEKAKQEAERRKAEQAKQEAEEREREERAKKAAKEKAEAEEKARIEAEQKAERQRLEAVRAAEAEKMVARALAEEEMIDEDPDSPENALAIAEDEPMDVSQTSESAEQSQDTEEEEKAAEEIEEGEAVDEEEEEEEEVKVTKPRTARRGRVKASSSRSSAAKSAPPPTRKSSRTKR